MLQTVYIMRAATALLIDKGFSSKTHSGVICILGQEFVMKGLLDKEDARLASRLLNMRQAGDYDDLFDWTEEEVAPLFPQTETLLSKLKSLYSSQTNFVTMANPMEIKKPEEKSVPQNSYISSTQEISLSMPLRPD